MKKAVSSDSGVRRTGPAPADPATPPGRIPVFKAPFRPRPRLFYVMLGLVGVWVGLLLTLYFITVLPHRDDRPPHEAVEPNSVAGVPH